jgi:hypothetical protein
MATTPTLVNHQPFFSLFGCLTLRTQLFFLFLRPGEKEIDVGETFHYNRPDSAQLKHRWTGKRKSIEHVNYFEKLRGCVLVFADLVTPRSKHPNHIRTIFLDQNVKY